jgi:hypothetical protein
MTTYSLGSGTTSDFVNREYAKVDLKDARLNKRAKEILKMLQTKLGSCIRRVFTNEQEARQAYDFFSNAKVTKDRLIEPHYEQSVCRIKSSQSKYILAIQDQMRLNYTHHLAKHDLGRIGKTGKTTQYGLIQHSVLCVDDRNEPLGLIDLSFFDFSEFDTEVHRDKRSVAEKTRCYWVDGLNRMRARLGNECVVPIITVADREGDFYEWLQPLVLNKEAFVIRAQYNRVTGETFKKGNKKLKAVLDESAIRGEMDVVVQNTASREMTSLRLKLKATQITLPTPQHFNKEQIQANQYGAIELNVVCAYDGEYEWILLTSLPVNTLEQLQEVVSIYQSRWHIEDYHKVLKTGYQVDEIYLHSSREAIINFLLLASISACRLYWLIYVGRTETEICASRLFEEFEWKSVYVYFNEPIPVKAPPIATTMQYIARLGGYKPSKKAQPPGIKTFWIGFQVFTPIAHMYRNMSRKT